MVMIGAESGRCTGLLSDLAHTPKRTNKTLRHNGLTCIHPNTPHIFYGRGAPFTAARLKSWCMAE